MYDPVMTELSPASESTVKLSLFKCTTGCLTQSCKCKKKNSYVCSELCHCKRCKNIERNLYPEDFVADCLSSFLEVDNEHLQLFLCRLYNSRDFFCCKIFLLHSWIPFLYQDIFHNKSLTKYKFFVLTLLPRDLQVHKNII